VYIRTATALWRSDGSVAGTHEVSTFGSRPTFPIVRHGDALFFANWTDESDTRSQLWRSNWTAAGTAPIWQSDQNCSPYGLVVAGDHFFFSCANGGSGIEPHVSDGTPAGTRLLANIAPGDDVGSLPNHFTPFGDLIVFDADDHTHGRELWISDGTTTTMLTDLAAGEPSSIPADGSDEGVFIHGDLAYLNAVADNDERLLLRTDGTPAGNVVLRSGSFVRDLTAVDEHVVFIADSCAGKPRPGLWQTDGTPDGTACIFALADDQAFEMSTRADLVQSGGRLYFAVSDPPTGRELWSVTTASLFCRGDLDGDRAVSIGELVTGITSALGEAPARVASGFDRNRDGRVDIAELIAAISAATSGCTTVDGT
ncbi:MAG TPA: hypothetical protein VGC36_09650, partial [Rhizomicrobium sp.]